MSHVDTHNCRILFRSLTTEYNFFLILYYPKCFEKEEIALLWRVTLAVRASNQTNNTNNTTNVQKIKSAVHFAPGESITRERRWSTGWSRPTMMVGRFYGHPGWTRHLHIGAPLFSRSTAAFSAVSKSLSPTGRIGKNAINADGVQGERGERVHWYGAFLNTLPGGCEHFATIIPFLNFKQFTCLL